MAARERVVYHGAHSLLGALMAESDDDSLVGTLEAAEQEYRGTPAKPALDAIEILIAKRVDDGETLPITNPEGYGAARWLSQGNLTNLPDPIPRAFVLYLAKAWADAGKFPNFTAALNEILTTRTFS